MTYARQADAAFPQSALYVIAAAFAAVVLVAIVAISTLQPSGLGAPVDDAIVRSPAVIESGRQWELERRQQSGYLDRVLDSGDEWERERRQQNGG